jgi:4a-hydroxytetrahydrobiopterin dehydratase
MVAGVRTAGSWARSVEAGALRAATAIATRGGRSRINKDLVVHALCIGVVSECIMKARAVDDSTSPPMTLRLSDLEIQRALASLPGWSRRGTVLTKTFAWPTFARGIEFVDRVAKAADAANHHPDIDIRYSKVTCTLSTHDAGGITEKDLELAAEIERLAEA